MDVKLATRKHLDSYKDKLIKLSHDIHANPEIAYEEEKTSLWLSEFLDAAGFNVEQGVAGLPTAFKATFGSGPLNIGICAELDALPGVGHACGHNIIATSGVGAGLAVAKVADDLGLTVTVLGTPAEEYLKSGGKIVMLENGVFDGLHAALMNHPMSLDIEEMAILAASFFEIRYRGKSAHASGAPEKGINAADAMTIAQTAIGLMRPTLRSTDRVHGIITKGGDAHNIIPELVTAEYAVRAKTLNDLEEVYAKTIRAFEAGALALGAELTIDGGSKPFAHMEHDHEMASLYRSNMENLGRSFATQEQAWGIPVSTDMGNISLAIPSIHPGISIDTKGAANHQPEFADACATESADQAVYDGALGMAWTAIDIANNENLRTRLLKRK